MKHTSLRALLSFAVVCLTASMATPAFAQKAIVVVRHAEKVDESRDPLLSPAGTARAEALAKILKSLDIKAVYVTQFQRTTLTAAPTMAARNLKPIEVSAGATPELVERMKKEFPNDVVMTVGHSNTVPAILKALGATETVELADAEYDNLFIVVPAASGPPTVLRLRY
ncbi:MAG: histidine phosphatase family protein [Vicinamibacteria bacterium]